MMKAEEALALANKYTDTHGGGGGGTSDYPDLTHKPQVNGVTLVGNKTSADLGLMDYYDIDERPTESSENLITSGGVWSADKNINNKLQGSKTAGSTDGSPFEIPDYGMTESIQMYFKPTQDLHGYDKPWAGGAGKNKFIYPYPTSSSEFGGITWTITPYEIHLAGASRTGFTIVLAGRSSSTWGNVGNAVSLVGTDGSYTFSGGTSKVPLVVFQYRNGVRVQEYRTTSATTIEIEASDLFEIGLAIGTGVTYDDSISPQIELGQTATTFEPYSNICPISGQDNATFEWTGKNKWDEEWELGIYNVDTGEKTPNNNYIRSTNAIPVSGSTQYYFYSDNVPARILFYDSKGGFLSTLSGWKANTTVTTPANCAYVRFFMDNSYGTEYDNNIAFNYPATVTTYSRYIHEERTMDFGNTYYGGFCQFNGQIYPEWDYIASYNGETLSGEWVSDRDEYVAGTTPTIGAEVAYKTTPSYARVTPPANLNLTDDYPIEYNGYMASIGYQPKNTVLAEAKKYTNQEIAKLGLPQPPTTDGTYHLECSVSGGIPTIRWVSNS